MNKHHFVPALLGNLAVALVLVSLDMPLASATDAPSLPAAITPTAFTYLPYVAKRYPPLEDFEVSTRLIWWSPDPPVFSYFRTGEQAHTGDRSLRIDYRKSSAYQFIGAELSPELRNLTYAQSLWVWVYGQVTLLLKLEDEQLRQAEVATLTTASPTTWTLLRFNYAHTAASIDLAHVKNLFFFPAPGNPTATGIIYLDDLSLSEEP